MLDSWSSLDEQSCSEEEEVNQSPRSARKSILDSLAKKRRTMTYREEVSEDDDFVVSDGEDEFSESSSLDSSNDSSTSKSSGEGSEDIGFYARISNMMDRRDRKTINLSDSLSPRTAFFEMLKFYGICMMSPRAQFPRNNKVLRKELATMQAGVGKIEDSLITRRQLTTPSYWKPDSDLIRTLNRFPTYQRSRHRHERELCDACNKSAQLSATVTLKGHRYDSQQLWKGDVRGWLKSMRLPLLVNDSESSETSSSSDSWSDEASMVSMTLGDKCLSNVQIYHTLQHAKHRILMELYRWMVANRLAISYQKFIDAMNSNKDGIVEQWYEKYKEDTELSEKNCARFTDPLGSHSPGAPKSARKSVSKW
jgi:hypothetical protein